MRLIRKRIDTDDLLRYAVLALVVIIGSSLLTWDSVLSCVRGIMTVRQMEGQIHEFSNQIKNKKIELNCFKDDFYVENLARRELGLTRPNEIEYRFTETTEGP